MGFGNFRPFRVQRLQPVVWGFLFVAAVWTGVGINLRADLRSGLRESDRMAQNFALVFEENVLRSIGEIDKSLLYLRHRIRNRLGSEDYGTIASTTDVLSEIIVQVAIIGPDGYMRATNSGPMPEKPLYLGDRPHFRAHLGSTRDALYVGAPLVGRASGKISVQLSRRFLTPDGQFGGVVVASLDPSHLTRFYDKIDLGLQASVALIGEDGIVRSSGGADDGFALGADLSGTDLFAQAKSGIAATFDFEDPSRGLRRVTTRKVRGEPLLVSVDIARADIDREAWSSLGGVALLALGLTLLAGLAVMRLQRIETKRREAEAHVMRLASQDPLTGLANRRVFRVALDEAVAAANQPEGSAFALMFLDVDRFKLLNDTLGHKKGDELLMEIGRRISGLLSDRDRLARFGGDEFAVLLWGVSDHEAVAAVAQRMVDALKPPVALGSQRAQASVSIGIAIGLQDGSNADDLLVAADLALYAVKGSGRGTYRFYDAAMSESVTDRGQLENDLRVALERGELELHFQPSIATRSGEIAGFEALSRWRHPVRGNIPPMVFIAIAEECGLIHDIGAWSLAEACRQAAAWPEHMKVAVNLSPAQFAGPDLVGMVSGVLQQTGFPAARLELELTEQLLLSSGERTLGTLRDLKALGVKISMDDFGTGYSSLNYLRRFPFDRIKIDRSFVTELADGPQHLALVKAVVDVARSLGMATTAEGVETQGQQLHLAALGCDELQGYLFSRPVPAADVPRLIAGWPAARDAARDAA